MPALTPAYDLRPLGLGEILDYTFRLYQRIFPFAALTTILLQGLPFAPLFFAATAIQQFSIRVQENPDLATDADISWAGFTAVMLEEMGLDLTWTVGQTLEDWLRILGMAGLFLLFASLAAIVLKVILVGLTSQRILGIEPTWSGVGMLARRFTWRAFLAGLLQGLLIFVLFMPALLLGYFSLADLTSPNPVALVAFVLVIIPSYIILVWLVIALYLTECALIVENLTPWGAIRRSLAMVQGHWWRIFGATLILGIITQIIQSLSVGISGPLLILLFPRYELAILTILQTLATVFLLPLSYILVALLYIDIRVRSEQFDLYFLLGDQPPLQETPPEPPPDPGFVPTA